MFPSDFGVRPSTIVSIWIVEGVPERIVISSVRSIEYQAEPYSRSNEPPVKWSIHIVSVIHINVSGMVIIKSSMVIIDVHATYSKDPTVTVSYIDITNLIYTTIIVIINGCILYLNYRAIVIILCVGTIIVT